MFLEFHIVSVCKATVRLVLNRKCQQRNVHRRRIECRPTLRPLIPQWLFLYPTESA